jgi:hypothetical protein
VDFSRRCRRFNAGQLEQLSEIWSSSFIWRPLCTRAQKLGSCRTISQLSGPRPACHPRGRSRDES